MTSDAPGPVFLKDYAPPPYLVDRVDLDVRLAPRRTRVKARLDMRRNRSADAKPAPLILDGEHLELTGLILDGRLLDPSEYALSDTTLTVHEPPPEAFVLEIETYLDPDANTALTGLYRSNDTYCTQCEAEGFRRITYYPDRPDVMAVFTTRIEARKTDAPVLLANGNLVDSGKIGDTDKHFALWHDPHPKPCYLFALVGGALNPVKSTFTTMTDRKVELVIYVEPGREDRVGYAMAALKRAMKWDEEKFGREYDLDIFMIVAVSDFNMGAMENKGLNIFNDKYILADPKSATDNDYAGIESVIAHEYFHNWTGNRVTCRDWFQLCLKEGLTVFRDQEFSADMRSPVVQRIDDVRQLLNHQFPEDAGPLAHPVRPQSYFEINNFYTATVYEKGAEVVRMLKTLIGDKAFFKGMNLYFDRHDGCAVTVEDFLAAMADASGVDLKQFKTWYAQAGTPELTVSGKYHAKTRTFKLNVTQFCPPSPGQIDKPPFHVPLKLGLVDRSGGPITLKSNDLTGTHNDVVEIIAREQTFTFSDVRERPALSLLRDFSAPVRLISPHKEKDLLFLMVHDPDLFNRWRAGQTYATRLLKRMARDFQRGQPLRRGAKLADALRQLILAQDIEPAFRARCLELPSLAELARDIGRNVDPEALHGAREHLRASIGTLLEDELAAIARGMGGDEPYSPDAASAGRRALVNGALRALVASGKSGYLKKAGKLFETANNMTDTMAALGILTHQGGVARTRAFDSFYETWKNDPLVLDKWFMLQANSTRKGTLNNVKRLKRHDAFTMTNPNRVRALIGTFAMTNMVRFNAADGSGYCFVADAVLELDAINPQVAARLAGTFKSWRIFEPKRRGLMKAQLARIAAARGLSRDTLEIVSKSLRQTPK